MADSGVADEREQETVSQRPVATPRSQEQLLTLFSFDLTQAHGKIFREKQSTAFEFKIYCK